MKIHIVRKKKYLKKYIYIIKSVSKTGIHHYIVDLTFRNLQLCTKNRSNTNILTLFLNTSSLCCRHHKIGHKFNQDLKTPRNVLKNKP